MISTAPAAWQMNIIYRQMFHLLQQVLRIGWLTSQALRQDHSKLVRGICTQGPLDDCSICTNGAASVDVVPL